MFALLRSRWMIERSCECASALAICTPYRITDSTGNPAPPIIRALPTVVDNDRPSTSSITIYGSPWNSPISYIVQMLGWLRADDDRASCNRCPLDDSSKPVSE